MVAGPAPLTDEQREKKTLAMFSRYDQDKSGFLSKSELQLLLGEVRETLPILAIPLPFRQRLMPLLVVLPQLFTGQMDQVWEKPFLPLPLPFRQRLMPLLVMPQREREGTLPLLALPLSFYQRLTPLCVVLQGWFDSIWEQVEEQMGHRAAGDETKIDFACFMRLFDDDPNVDTSDGDHTTTATMILRLLLLPHAVPAPPLASLPAPALPSSPLSSLSLPPSPLCPSFLPCSVLPSPPSLIFCLQCTLTPSDAVPPFRSSATHHKASWSLWLCPVCSTAFVAKDTALALWIV